MTTCGMSAIRADDASERTSVMPILRRCRRGCLRRRMEGMGSRPRRSEGEGVSSVFDQISVVSFIYAPCYNLLP